MAFLLYRFIGEFEKKELYVRVRETAVLAENSFKSFSDFPKEDEKKANPTKNFTADFRHSVIPISRFTAEISGF